MEKKYSILLDLIRALAALTVFLAHFSYLGYKGEYQGFFHKFGHTGVIMFFVLSGYVIAYVADAKHFNFVDFMTARLARLYSVLLLALLLTVLLDRIGAAFNPDIYSNIPNSDPYLRFFSNLLFLHQTSWWSIKYFSNGPMWSLAYEFWYYLIFAVAIFVHGKYKWLLLFLVMFVAGIKILLLMPCWLLGVYIYNLHKGNTVIIQESLAVVLIILSSVLFWYLAAQQELISHVSNYLWYYHINPNSLVFSKWFLTDFILSTIFAIFLFSIRYCPLPAILFKPTTVSVIRVMAGFSFSLYLFHVPLILFIDSLRFFNNKSAFSSIVFFAFVLLLTYILSLYTEKKLPIYRKVFDTILNNKPSILKRQDLYSK